MTNRILHGIKFKSIGDIRPVRLLSGAIQKLLPHSKFRKKNHHRLHRYGRGPFCKFSIAKEYSKSGVYLLTVDTRVMYVGECVHLYNRFNYNYGHISPRACFIGGQTTNCKINRQVLMLTMKGKKVRLWFHGTRNHKRVERFLLEKKSPPWNGRNA